MHLPPGTADPPDLHTYRAPPAAPRARVPIDPSWPHRLADLHTAVDDLVAEYHADHSGGAGDPYDRRPILTRLDDIDRRTSQPLTEQADTGGGGKPASRPPGPLDAASCARAIRDYATATDAYLRRSRIRRHWRPALDALPYLADARGQTSDVAHDLQTHRSTALTILGLQAPAQAFAARCWHCGGCSIRGRIGAPDAHGRIGDVRAWCTNPDCVDPTTGRRPVYDRHQVLMLAAADRKADHS